MEHFPLKNKLHTDILEKKYGKISAKIIKQDSRIRISHLIDEKGISRTFAITLINPEIKNKEVLEINEEIKKGETIGKAFRKKGYEIKKNVIDVFLLKLNKNLKESFKTDKSEAKARISEFYAKKNKEAPIVYGTVLEVYSPYFRKPKINLADEKQVNPTTLELIRKRISPKQVWEKLGKNTSWKSRDKKIITRIKADFLKEI